MLLGLSAALAAAAVFGFAAILQTRAVRRTDGADTPPDSETARFLVSLLQQPLFLVAVALSLIGFNLHLVAIRLIPLYLAQAGVAGSLAVTALLAVVLLHERLTAGDWGAVAAVTTGLALLAVAAGDIGDDDPPTGFIVWLFVGLAVIAAAGYLLTRSRNRFAAAMLGLLAGLGFAGSGVAARVLPGLTPSQLWDAPATYALPVSGALAFALYSFALRRGSVTEATAPMIVTQTVTPAVVGVLLLGDGVRHGWLFAAVFGFVLTAIGAVALARFETGHGASHDVPVKKYDDA
ncbi:MAG: hypothetical protein ABJA81_02880 [Nocardioidaceae bacterium]